MSGIENYNHDAFNAAETKLRACGYKVINPACLPTDLPPEKYMPICEAMIDMCDMVVLLPGWANSNGATAEWKYARENGTPCYILENFAIEHDVLADAFPGFGDAINALDNMSARTPIAVGVDKSGETVTVWE